MSRKIFVGSLPHGIEQEALKTAFAQYGQVTDVFIKPNCEVGRQWAFVTFASPEQAQSAKDLCDRKLTLPGAENPCDVMVAKNQGMFGQAGDAAAAPAANDGPRKIFVGSLPDGCPEELLRSEFSRYGKITDVFLKANCEPGRCWAFVSFSTGAEAALAKQSTDRILMLPGGTKVCEVTLAKNQGMFGQDSLSSGQQAVPAGPHIVQPPAYMQAAPSQAPSSGPRKIFVGSLPDNVSDSYVRQEFEKYGQVTDVFVKTGCEPGRQWAFVTFVTPEQAQFAKDNTDRVLTFPGADKACEVMLAKNQGKFGQEPISGAAPASAALVPAPVAYGVAPALVAYAAPPPLVHGSVQPPLPMAPPPAHLTPWRCYYTAAGLPYYHNHTTGVTQWEAPPELSMHAAPPVAASPASYGAVAAAGQPVRYGPY